MNFYLEWALFSAAFVGLIALVALIFHFLDYLGKWGWTLLPLLGIVLLGYSLAKSRIYVVSIGGSHPVVESGSVQIKESETAVLRERLKLEESRKNFWKNIAFFEAAFLLAALGMSGKVYFSRVK